ncbi:MAG: HNH endonuclease [Caldilineaceae bacterium]|nr:HNH endonuclease [Caldilineaceae bacterium]MCB0160065.1 HNH endonuclease [Caldilineaceae bacterium]
MAENSKIEWRSIPNWPMYRINSEGEVQSRWKPGGRRRIGKRWHSITGDIAAGYRRITLYDGNRRKRISVHRLVLGVFVGPCPRGMEACHRNGDRQDNRLSNLYWGTPQQNWRDRKRHGNESSTPGSKNIHAKLSEDDVIAIRSRLLDGEPGAALAKEYHVSAGTVSMIKNRQTWRHI